MQNYCDLCDGLGYQFQPSGKKENMSFVEPCSCVLKICNTVEEECIPPYMFVNPETNTLLPCACYPIRKKIDQVRAAYNFSGIPKKFRYRLLSSFNAGNQESLNIALDSVSHYLEKFDLEKTYHGLYMFGQPGSGKTMLGCLLLNELIFQYGISARYIKITRGLFDPIKSSYNRDSVTHGESDKIFQEIVASPVLMIDDVGVHKGSEWENRILYDLIDYRYEEELPTLITSNADPSIFKEVFFGRVYSRLLEMTHAMDMIANDYREQLSPY